jgi:PKD repeat protein
LCRYPGENSLHLSLPVSSFIINDSAQCFNEHAFTFTNHTSINSGTLSYFWDLDDGNTSTQTNVSHNYAYDDTFNVKLVNTSDLGCKDSLTKNVYLFPSPQLDFAINDSQQCFNENNFIFTNNSLINTGSQTFLWNFGDFNTSTTTSPTHIYNFDDTLTVTLFANSNLNCADTLQKTVYIFPSPVSNFLINDSAQCFNEHAFTFTNHTSINSGTLSYFWDLDDGNTSTQTNVSHNYAYDDTFNVKLVNSSDLGCKDSLTKNVYLFPSPQLDFAINDSQQCFNENNFVFTNNSLINTGSQTYLWNFGDFNTSSATSPTHIYNFDDTLTVTLFANSNLNCADTLQKTVYIFPSPVSNFIINDSDQCFNEHAFTFTNHTSINSGTLSYFWDLDDGKTSAQTNVSHNYAYDDTFNVKLVNTSDLGCKDSLTKNVYLFPSPKPDFVVNDTDQCFSGNNFVFTNQTTINTGSSTYSWDFGDMTTSSQTSPSKSYSAYDTFDVTMIATSDLNCQDTTSAQMIVFPMPEAGFTINDSDQCLRDNYFQFTDNSHIPYGSFTHFWNLGESATSTSQNPTHQYLNFDSITIGLWVTSQHGCIDSSFKNIVINPMPSASFIVNDSTQCFRYNQFNFTNTSVIPHGDLSAEWFFGDGDTSQTYSPKHPYSYPDTFPVSMIISSEEGCKDTAYSNSYVFNMPEADFLSTILLNVIDITRLTLQTILRLLLEI